MHDASKNIIITLIIILSAIIFYYVFIFTKTIVDMNKERNNKLFSLDEVEQDIKSGKYKVSNNSIYDESDEFSYLIIYSNGTYLLSINLCEGVHEYRGIYKVDNDKLTLKNVNNSCEGFINCDKKEFEFSIISKNKLSNKIDIGCLGKNSSFDLED